VPDFTLPELGENVSAGDVLRLLVKPGDTLAMDQPVLELETDKATIEVPSSVAGTVGEIKVKQGDKVKVGQVILTVTEEGKAGRQESGKAEGQGRKADGQEGKAGRQEGEKAEGEKAEGGKAEGEKAEGQGGKAARQESKVEGHGDAVGANTAAKVPDDEPGLEQHVEGNRRDTERRPPTSRRRLRRRRCAAWRANSASTSIRWPAPGRAVGSRSKT